MNLTHALNMSLNVIMTDFACEPLNITYPLMSNCASGDVLQPGQSCDFSCNNSNPDIQFIKQGASHVNCTRGGLTDMAKCIRKYYFFAPHFMFPFSFLCTQCSHSYLTKRFVINLLIYQLRVLLIDCTINLFCSNSKQ